jgi:Lar family restriction alleviation protein
MKMQNDKLLPCPFCGGEAQKFENVMKKGNWFVECRECGANVHYRTEESAIRAWNTRKPMERIVEQLEEESDFFGGEPMGTLQKLYYCKGITKAIEIVRNGGKE